MRVDDLSADCHAASVLTGKSQLLLQLLSDSLLGLKQLWALLFTVYPQQITHWWGYILHID